MTGFLLADERGLELLELIGRHRDGLPGRLLAATRAQLRAGSHVATPARALQRPPGGLLFPGRWSPEAEACAWRGAGVYLDFVLGLLVAFEGRVGAWGEPWHWLLEPDEVAPTPDEARYRIVMGRWSVVSVVPLPAEQAAAEVRRWAGRPVRAELDIEASLAVARRRLDGPARP